MKARNMPATKGVRNMPCLRYLVVTAALLVLAGRTCLAADASDERRPVPAAAELAKAQKLVKELLGDEIAKTKPAGRAALAARILKQADESRDDAAGRYVLLCPGSRHGDQGGRSRNRVQSGRGPDGRISHLGRRRRKSRLPPLSTAPMNVETSHLAADVLLTAARRRGRR